MPAQGRDLIGRRLYVEHLSPAIPHDIEQWRDINELIADAIEMRPCAAPAPLSRTGGKPRPHRISLDVARAGNEMALVHHV